MGEKISIGFSTCPNDTYIFHALASGLIDTGGIEFSVVMDDVEALNGMAMRGELDVIKVSYGAYASFADRYCLLRAGGALGRGCGPLVVARPGASMESIHGGIAVPGLNTTAFLLLRLYNPALEESAMPMRFDLIMPAVSEGRAQGGLIIHESRFTYKEYGLVELLDLGAWWEGETGLPIPLGAIVARRTLGAGLVSRVEGLIRKSLMHANANPSGAMAYMRHHARELADDVILKHVGLYVNEFSMDLGQEGAAAAETLFRIARARGLLIREPGELFITPPL